MLFQSYWKFKMGQMSNEELAARLALAIASKNTIKESEFLEFVPLFTKRSLPRPTETTSAGDLQAYNESVEDLTELAKRWGNRISLADEVKIVDDTTSEVLMVLPAVRSEVPLLNLVTPEAGALMDALGNAMARSTGARDLSAPYMERLSAYLNAGLDKDKISKDQKRFTELSMAIEHPGEKIHSEESAPDTKKNLDGANWN
jgi:hypothetical protein